MRPEVEDGIPVIQRIGTDRILESEYTERHAVIAPAVILPGFSRWWERLGAGAKTLVNGLMSVQYHGEEARAFPQATPKVPTYL